jgi:hypothetical protein
MPGSSNPAGAAGPAGHAPLLHGRRPELAEEASEPAAQVPDRGSLELQQTAGNSAVGAMLAPTRGDLVRSVVGRPGRPVGGDVVDLVRDATGDDASRIQVHEGADAEVAARAVEAEMFASGNHIVAPKGLDVSTREGAFKTVHEVHHILNQQAKGPVEGTETDDGLKISDPGDRHEREADEVAARAVRRQFGR